MIAALDPRLLKGVWSLADLSGAQSQPLVGREFFQTHRTARAHFVGTNSDFRAHSKFTAVGETCRRVPVDGCGIHLIEKLVGGGGIARDDTIRVRRSKLVD